MKILQLFTTVAVISFFVCILYFMKYVLLYQYLTHDDTNNITVSIVITTFIIIKQTNAGTYYFTTRFRTETIHKITLICLRQ